MFAKYVARVGGGTGAKANVQPVRQISELGDLPPMSKAPFAPPLSPSNSDRSDNVSGSTPPASPACFSDDSKTGGNFFGNTGEDSYVVRAGSRPAAVRTPHIQNSQLPSAMARELLESQEAVRKDIEQLRKDLESLSKRIEMVNTGANAQAAATYAAEAGRKALISDLEVRARTSESKLEAYSVRLCTLEASLTSNGSSPRSRMETPNWGLDAGQSKEPADDCSEPQESTGVALPTEVASRADTLASAMFTPLALSGQTSVPTAPSAAAAAATAITPPASAIPADFPAAVAELAGPAVAAAVAHLATEIREELTSSFLFFQDGIEKKIGSLEHGLDEARTVSRKSGWNAGWRAGQLEQYARKAAPREAANYVAESGLSLCARNCDESLDEDRNLSLAATSPTVSPTRSPTMSPTPIKFKGDSPPLTHTTVGHDDWSEVGLEVATERKRGCLR